MIVLFKNMTKDDRRLLLTLGIWSLSNLAAVSLLEFSTYLLLKIIAVIWVAGAISLAGIFVIVAIPHE
jgi:hypothetical protein